MTTSAEFKKQLEGYGLTTAKIIYRLPDYKSILQTFVWQTFDIHPKFPELHKFLGFWEERIEGPIHSVTVVHHRLVTPAEVRLVGSEFHLN